MTPGGAASSDREAPHAWPLGGLPPGGASLDGLPVGGPPPDGASSNSSDDGAPPVAPRLLLLGRPPTWEGRALTGRLQDLLCTLALAEGDPVGPEDLTRTLWPVHRPDHPRAALQVLVSRARRQLGGEALPRRGEGYALGLDTADVDYLLLVARTRDARAALARQDPTAVVALTRALPDIGPGAGGVEDDGPREELLARAAVAGRQCRRTRALALDALGRYAEAVAQARLLIEDLPDDEPLLAALVRGEAWTGSPAAALIRYEDYRRRLRLVGAVPGPVLRAAHEAALAAEHPVRRGLGHSAVPLRGRDRDLRAVEDAIATRRLVTVTGPGGVGKTRLAQEVASRSLLPVVHVLTMTVVAPRETAAPMTLGLSERRATLTHLARGLLGALGERPHPGQDPRSALAQALSAPGTLLVLDDCEHVAEPLAELLGPLLAAQGELRVLVTSRRVLDLAAEHAHRLAPLEMRAARELFRERALVARPGQSLDDKDLERLLPALEGMPLAIELAAARTRAMSVRQVADRLARDLTTLSGPRDLPERQRTLTAVIEWSWRLLLPEQRRALARCALLADGFTLETAEAVLGSQAPLLIDALVAHSLLHVDAADPPRLHLLASVREFVLSWLDGDADEAAARRAVRTWALGLAEAVLVPGQAGGSALSGADTHIMDAVLAQEDSMVLELRRAREEATGNPENGGAREDVLVIGAALIACWSSSWCYSQAATWLPLLVESAVTPAPDARGNTARMLILHRATTSAWLLGPLPESVRSRVPESFAGEDAWMTAIRRLVRSPHEAWPALAEDRDPWMAWVAGCCVVMGMENRGDVLGALGLNRALVGRIRAEGLPPERVFEGELDGLRLVLETGDYVRALRTCTRLLEEPSSPLREVYVEALDLQRRSLEVYLDPTPPRAQALLRHSASIRVPGMAAFVAGFLSGELEALCGQPRQAALTPRVFLNEIGADASVPVASPWEVYGMATCLILDLDLDEATAAELDAPAMRRRGLRTLGRILDDPGASQFDLPTTASLACAVGLSCALGQEGADDLGAGLLAAALACGPNQTSRLLSCPELERRAEALDPGAWAAARRGARSATRAELVSRMTAITTDLAARL